MNFTALQEGHRYRFANNIGNRRFWTNVEFDRSKSKHWDPAYDVADLRNAFLVCEAKYPSGRKVIDGQTKWVSNNALFQVQGLGTCKKLRCYNMVYLTTDQRSVAVEADPQDSREVRTKVAKEQLLLLQQRQTALTEELADIEIQVSAKTKEIKALTKFKSDAEEFAYFLGEVVQSGGDPKKIMEMMTEKGMLDKIDMAAMHKPKPRPRTPVSPRFRNVEAGKDQPV